MEKNKLTITPKTKVKELLDAYPDLEDTLIALASEFKRLKNPILRKTIARVATLQQAAQTAEISVDKVVNTLRKKAGQEEFDFEEQGVSRSEEAPKWFDESKIVKEFDARPTLEKGGHPVDIVLREARDLKLGEIFKLTTPFLPAPLIDKVVDQGFRAWVKNPEPDVFDVYFTPA